VLRRGGETDIYQHYRQFYDFSKYNIARNIICFNRNIIIARQKIFSPSYLLILSKAQLSSEDVFQQEFKPKYA